MAKTNAQRQAEYRDGVCTRLNIEVSLVAHFALERPAHHHGLTQRQMLEQLITGPHEALCKSLEGDDFCLYIDMGAS
ncbi:TPA: hypothetical protein ACSTL1_002751 [Serratia fonticola]|jgi:hypothetical protein|uniref:hypothetical protein n=1 Tax=Serratia fonticola TaxID=47917 RepID=UPI000FA79246|nr:hypothetical protein [Serratia fonticola]CAI2154469.1 Uncharacterised protein [Serratia fonticola]